MRSIKWIELLQAGFKSLISFRTGAGDRKMAWCDADQSPQKVPKDEDKDSVSL